MRSSCLLLLLAIGCAHGPRTTATFGGECRILESFPGAAEPEDEHHPDLARLLPGRHTFALERVGAPGHHFTVWYHHIEGNVCHFRVALDGRDVEGGRCAWGGVAQRPAAIPPIPDAVAPIARSLLARVRAACPGGGDFAITYDGEYRDLAVTEIAASPRAPGHLGSQAHVLLRADDALTRLVGTSGGIGGGEGILELPRSARWFDVPLVHEDKEQVAWRLLQHDAHPDDDDTRALVERLLAEARAVDAGQAADPAALDRILERQRANPIASEPAR